MTKYTPMIEQYLEIKNQYKDCIVFFQLGDFFEMFFEDAHIAAQVLGIALTGRDAGQPERIPMCGIPIHAIDNYLPKLIEKGYKVAICEQIEKPSEAKVVVKRDVTRIVTPGITIEDNIIDNNTNHYVVCVYKQYNQYAISAADITTGDFFISSYDNFSTKSIINEILAYSPKEILLTFNDDNFTKILNELKLYITYIKDYITDDYIDPISVFENYFNNHNFQYPNNLNIIEKHTVGWLLFYINKTQKRLIHNLNKLNKKDIHDRMILDYNARRNLELTETLRTKEKNGSLLWILDKTVSASGARMLRSWLENPLTNILNIKNRLNAVEQLCNEQYYTKEITHNLKMVYDIERLLSKISYGTANAKDLISLKNTLSVLPDIKDLIKHFTVDILIDIYNDLTDVSKLTHYLDSALIDNSSNVVKDTGLIKPGFNSILDEYREMSLNGKNWLIDFERKERERTNIKSLKIGYNRIFGYFIEITKSNLSQVPENYERKQTLANSERYVTDELKIKEEMILKAEDNLIELEKQLFLEIREYTLSFVTELQRIAKALAVLDVLQSFANVSILNGYIKPKFNNNGEITIKEGRHPVVEKVIKNELFVPNDIFLNNNESQIQLITGPNMAGKSTYMRQIALTLIMAQIGSYVPADYADLCIVDRIFTRIGASDDLTSGQSTFMVEMVETKEALLEASNNSLILLDEVGRGTSTYDGIALAQSIIEYIDKYVKAKTLFSTHYHELTELENDISSLKNYNASCIEKDKKVIFLHKIIEGKADKSYGIYVADLAGMPAQVTYRAKELLDILESDNYRLGPSNQLSMFNDSEILNNSHLNIDSKEYKVLSELKQIQVMQISPIDALNYIYKLQKTLAESGE